MKRKTEYQKFNAMMGQLLKVPHSEIKAKLEAEKSAKKRKKSRVSSASRVGA